MRDFIQILIFVIMGAVFLWFGYSLISGHLARFRADRPPRLDKRSKKAVPSGDPGDPQVCPICSSKLEQGDLVKTLTYPSITGGNDRLMHIKGCKFCIEGRLERHCPVCKKPLGYDDILVARMFERKRRRNHVHVVGCNQCRRLGV